MFLPCLSDLFNRNGIMLSIRIRKLFAAIFITLIVLSCVACSGLDILSDNIKGDADRLVEAVRSR